MLRVERDVGLVDAANYGRLCQPFLMEQAHERFKTNSHFVWMDFASLEYPVYPKEKIRWEEICHGKISMAMVNGLPDVSMCVIPSGLLNSICRELTGLCDDSIRRTGTLPRAEVLWLQVMREHPDWFDLHVLPGERQLFSEILPSVQREKRKRFIGE